MLPVGTLIARRQPFHRQVREMMRGLLRNCPSNRREYSSSFHFLKCCCVEQIQFFITQVFDGLSQVLGQDMPLRRGFGRRFRGRFSPWRRRSISDCNSREEVWRNLLTTVASHGMIMALGMKRSQRLSIHGPHFGTWSRITSAPFRSVNRSPGYAAIAASNAA